MESKLTMNPALLKELEAARAKVANLEQGVALELTAELASLPSKYGFENPKAFLKAVRAATGFGKGRARRAELGRKGKRTRTKITDAIRSEVKKLATGGKTGAEIAKAVGISLPSVQKIKEAFGLVKKRK